jgi:hypothetical protein
MTDLYYAMITDDEGDTTYGPPETYANAMKRITDAVTDDGVTSATVVPVK